MKTSILRLSIALMSLAFVGVSCEKDEDGSTPENVNTKEVTLSRKTAYGNDWIYFSLSKGTEVTLSEADHMKSLDWDLAFNRYNIRTNSGVSGSGKGGAYDLGKVNFNSVLSLAADKKIVVDVVKNISGVGTGFPPPEIESTANLILCEAIGFTGPPPAYTPNEHVYVVKTADGKYAKVIFTSFYDQTGNSGFVSFKYAYQADGTSSFPAAI